METWTFHSWLENIWRFPKRSWNLWPGIETSGMTFPAFFSLRPPLRKADYQPMSKDLDTLPKPHHPQAPTSLPYRTPIRHSSYILKYLGSFFREASLSLPPSAIVQHSCLGIHIIHYLYLLSLCILLCKSLDLWGFTLILLYLFYYLLYTTIKWCNILVVSFAFVQHDHTFLNRL